MKSHPENCFRIFQKQILRCWNKFSMTLQEQLRLRFNEMNEEEKTYKKLLDDLKNLPKVDAPKNFETELLRKINSSEPEKKESFWDKLLSPAKLAPAAVAIASAAIIFFVVDINSEEMEDPLNIAPRLREDVVVIESIEEIPIESLKKSAKVKEESKVLNEGLDGTKEIETQIQPKVGLDERSDQTSKGIEQSTTDELVSPKSESDRFKSDDQGTLGKSAAPSVTTLASEINKADSLDREMKTERNEIQNLPVLQGSSDQMSKDNFNFMQRNLSAEEKKEVQQLKLKVQAEKSEKTEQKSN